jgi:hypothetical protein
MVYQRIRKFSYWQMSSLALKYKEFKKLLYRLNTDNYQYICTTLKNLSKALIY